MTKYKKPRLKPVLAALPDPLDAQPPAPVTPKIVKCPAPARAILQKRIDDVRQAQARLQETASAIAAGLGIDYETEAWTLDADHGLFVKKS